MENQGTKDVTKYDPLDMKKKTKPTEEELKKKEMLMKRKEIMKLSEINTEKNRSFLPLLDESINGYKFKSP